MNEREVSVGHTNTQEDGAVEGAVGEAVGERSIYGREEDFFNNPL